MLSLRQALDGRTSARIVRTLAINDCAMAIVAAMRLQILPRCNHML